MRVKLLRDYKGFEKGEIHHFRDALALKLVQNGVAIISKDIVPDDYKQAGDTQHGSTIKLRTNKSS